jgi:membrane associated rhomboid family serine protease
MALSEISVPQCLQITSCAPEWQLYTAGMIPVRDVIPTRTRPVATLVFIGAMAGALAWPAVRQWWLPWAVHMVILWLFAGTVEDRLGHARFVMLLGACMAAAGAMTSSMGWPATAPVAVTSAVAGVSAAYFLMFPRSRVLTLVPVVVGVDVVDVPAWFILGLWLLVQAVDISSRAVLPGPHDGIAGAVAVIGGAIVGSAAWLALRRPERMRVEWWDPPPAR